MRSNMRPEANIPKFVQEFLDTLPKDLGYLRADLEKNCRTALSALLERMDLVTREEFDIQLRLQQRLQETVGELRQRISALEGERPEIPAPETKREPSS